MKKGFTLIELLAIIIILAIIALIATPIVMNVIENARKGAAERSAENIEHAADIYYYNNGGLSEIIFRCKDGVCSNGEKNLKINGKGPEDGIIKISKEGEIALNSIVINGHSCYKNGESYTCEKADKISESTTNGVLTLSDSKTTTLSNYIIKGNSYQATRSGKNLFDPKKWEIGKIFKGSGKNSTVWYADDSKYASYLYMPMEADTKYTFSVNSDIYWIDRISEMDSSDLCTVNFAFYAWNDNHATYTWTTKPTTTYMAIRFTRVDGADITENDIKNIKFQLEKGSTATEYEPYGVMPSPEFPSEIQSVGDLVTEEGPNKGKYEIPIKVTGKNLWYKPNKEYRPTINVNIAAGTEITLSQDTSYVAELNYTDGTKGYVETYNLASDGRYYSTFEAKKDISSIMIRFTPENTQLVIGTSVDYEPYQEQITIIYLDEPLRCLGDVCDYIDYKSQKLYRYIQVVDDTGTKSIKESLTVLSKPKEQQISLPEININKSGSNLFIDTTIKPSEVIVDYYN